MIVKFTTGNHFSPDVRSRVDIFRNKTQMRREKPFFTGLEPLDISAKNAARMVKENGGEKVTIVFDGYLPEDRQDIVFRPFRKRNLTISRNIC